MPSYLRHFENHGNAPHAVCTTAFKIASIVHLLQSVLLIHVLERVGDDGQKSMNSQSLDSLSDVASNVPNTVKANTFSNKATAASVTDCLNSYNYLGLRTMANDLRQIGQGRLLG
jgi:hypothetical protein